MSSGPTTKRYPSVEELRLARVYAEAVWAVASKQNAAHELLEEFESLIKDVIDPQPELEIFLTLASISQERRGELLEKVFKGRASELLYSFLRTLNQHDRLGLLQAVGICLRQILDESEGRVPVLVRTAVSLDKDQLDAVVKLLETKLKVKPDLTTEVDPRILGGLWMRVGDKVYDRSVRWNLNQLRESILTRSSHEIQSGRDIVDHST